MVEAYRHLHQPTAVCGVRDEVSAVIYLPQRLLYRTIQLELKDVDDVRRLHHGIRPATDARHLGPRVLPQKTEDDVENGLVMTLLLRVQLVRNTCEEGAEAGEESVYVARPQLLDELADEETRFILRQGRIERRGEVQEAVLHLLVGETERVELELRVVRLDRQVSALVDHRDGIVDVRPVIRQRGFQHL